MGFLIDRQTGGQTDRQIRFFGIRAAGPVCFIVDHEEARGRPRDRNGKHHKEHTYMHMRVLYMYMCMYMCMYIYIYIYMYARLQIYMHLVC